MALGAGFAIFTRTAIHTNAVRKTIEISPADMLAKKPFWFVLSGVTAVCCVVRPDDPGTDILPFD
jgi:hypothetical protein